MHKYSDEVGQRLFKNFVRTIESLGSIESNTTLRQVAQQLVEREMARVPEKQKQLAKKEQKEMTHEDKPRKWFLAEEAANQDKQVKPKSMVTHATLDANLPV
jgi:hypothetical protein